MGEVLDTGKVDLRFAKAFVPVYIVFGELVLISAVVLFSPFLPTQSWTIAAIIVWFSARISQEQIFKYQSLLQTVTLASILSHYRVSNDKTISPVMEKIASVLWVVCFCFVNLTLGKGNTIEKVFYLQRIAMWSCTLLLMLYSIYTPLNDNIIACDVIKAFLFMILCVSWIYTHDQKTLRYDKLHDCEECKLRFLAVLFTPATVAVFMVFCIITWSFYGFLCGEKTAFGILPAEEDKLEAQDAVSFSDDQELFKFALQNKDASIEYAFKNA